MVHLLTTATLDRLRDIGVTEIITWTAGTRSTTPC
jgi:hypothetical protein